MYLIAWQPGGVSGAGDIILIALGVVLDAMTYSTRSAAKRAGVPLDRARGLGRARNRLGVARGVCCVYEGGLESRLYDRAVGDHEAEGEYRQRRNWPHHGAAIGTRSSNRIPGTRRARPPPMPRA